MISKKHLKWLVVLVVLSCLLSSCAAQADASGQEQGVSGFELTDWSGTSWSYDENWANTEMGSLYGASCLGGSLGGPIGLILIVVVLVILVWQRRKQKKKEEAKAANEPQESSMFVGDYTHRIIEAAQEFDPAFNGGRFIIDAKKSFLELQHAQQARDANMLGDAISDTVKSEYRQQIERDVEAHQIHCREQIVFKQVYLHHYYHSPSQDEITVFMDVTMLDYVVQEDAEAAPPSDAKNVQKRYILRFARNAEQLWVLEEISLFSLNMEIDNAGVIIENYWGERTQK